MATFSLDDIKAAAEAKYGSTDVDLGTDGVMVLVNPLRLDKAKRAALQKIQDSGDENEDQGDVMRKALRLVTSTPAVTEKFITFAGDDLALLATVFESYTDGVQVGEASASQG